MNEQTLQEAVNIKSALHRLQEVKGNLVEALQYLNASNEPIIKLNVDYKHVYISDKQALANLLDAEIRKLVAEEEKLQEQFDKL